MWRMLSRLSIIVGEAHQLWWLWSMKAQKLDILAIAGPSWTGDTYADNRPLPSWHSTQWHEAMTEGSRDKVCCRVWSAPGRAAFVYQLSGVFANRAAGQATTRVNECRRYCDDWRRRGFILTRLRVLRAQYIADNASRTRLRRAIQHRIRLALEERADTTQRRPTRESGTTSIAPCVTIEAARPAQSGSIACTKAKVHGRRGTQHAIAGGWLRCAR